MLFSSMTVGFCSHCVWRSFITYLYCLTEFGKLFDWYVYSACTPALCNMNQTVLSIFLKSGLNLICPATILSIKTIPIPTCGTFYPLWSTAQPIISDLSLSDCVCPLWIEPMSQFPVCIYISVDCVGKMGRIDCLHMWAAQFDVSWGVDRDWNVWCNLEELPEKSPPISILLRAKDSNFLLHCTVFILWFCVLQNTD